MTDAPPTLAEAGIDKHLAKRARKLAAPRSARLTTSARQVTPFLAAHFRENEVCSPQL